MKDVLTLTDETFASGTASGVVLVDFWETWCGPCRMQSAVIERVAPMMRGVQFCAINSDENPEVSTALGVSTLPTLMIYKDGKLVDRITGLLPEAQLRQRLEAQL